MANLLASETSPYLLSHKDNAVHWRPWGPEALAEAERSGKPVFLSLGYMSCHWCHLMAKESFSDAETAELLNSNFVCIKVDRDERPDLDAIFQGALAAMQTPGGWPLNMFLSPKGEPFAGGTYFPKETEADTGRPAFVKIVNDVLAVYRDNKTQVETNTNGVRQALTNAWMQDRRIDGQLSPIGLEQASRRTCQLMDVFSGGLNGTPKFPNVPIMEMMWRSFLRTNSAQYYNAADVQLKNMCLAGIYDHLGGGFHRYAADEFWLLPHFEKMLYDNALMIEIMSSVWQDSRNPFFKSRVEETVAWVQREMVTSEGGFAASLSADADGTEGAFYVWSASEIDAALSADDAKLFRAVYDVREQGNWQGKNVLHRLRAIQLEPMAEGRLNGIRQKLLEARNKRVRPTLDDTVHADWNGLMITALAKAGDVFNRIDWQAMAVRAFWFVADKMSNGDKLSHSYRAGKASSRDFAEDYTFMAQAAVTLFENTGDARYLQKAQSWIGQLDTRYWIADAGGYAQTPSDADTFLARPRHSLDSSTPSANGAAAKVLAQLFFFTGEEHYRVRANETMATFARDALVNAPMHASIYNALDNIIRALQIVIIGERQAPETVAMRDVLRRVSLPNRHLQFVTTTSALPATHPAYGKPQVQGRTTVYLCNMTQCSPPIIDANQFEMALKTKTVTQPTPR
jgi:uncharacterized protein